MGGGGGIDGALKPEKTLLYDDCVHRDRVLFRRAEWHYLLINDAGYEGRHQFSHTVVNNRKKKKGMLVKWYRRCYSLIFSSKSSLLVCIDPEIDPRTQEGSKEMLYLTTHSTHFYLRLYGFRHNYGKGPSDSERGNTLPPHGLLFPFSSKGSFICIIPHIG